MWLATVTTSGTPHVAPVWFVWHRPGLYFNTAPSTRKHQNLQAVSRVVAHLGDGDDVMIVHGHAVVVTEPVELRAIDARYRAKYVDPYSGQPIGFTAHDPDAPTERPMVLRPPVEQIPYRVTVERIIVWQYGDVATRTEFVPTPDGSWHTRPR